jgi:hypothetical protein
MKLTYKRFRWLSTLIEHYSRVENWRAHVRVRRLIHNFRCGPQSSSRLVEPCMQISRTRLFCPLRAKGYETYRTGDAFSRGS